MRNLKASFLVSALDPEDIQGLREYVIDYFLSKQEHFDLFVPYANGDAHSKLLGNANIITTHHHELGTYYRIRIPDFIFHQLGLATYVLAPNDPRSSIFDNN